MKICQINAVYEYGSTGRNVSELHNFLKENGIESYVFTSILNKKEKNVFKIGNKFDHKLHAFLSRIFGLQTYFSLISTKKIINNMKKINPDIFVLHNLHANYINLPLLMKYIIKNDKKVVIVLHDCYFLTAKCVHFTEINCNKWQTGCNKCLKLKSDIPNYFFDRTKKIWNDRKKWFNSIKNLGVVGVSRWTANLAENSYVKNAKIITYIYNWVDLELFRILDIKKELIEKYSNKKVILGVSSFWHNNKISKVQKLAQGLDDEYVVVLIGKIEVDTKLDNKIISVGVVSSCDELSQYYNLALVLYNPSKEETFGKVTAEALACGTPVVVYNSTANPELVGKKCGVIINDDDEAISAVLEIASKGKEFYSDFCRKFAEENFDKNKQCAKYLNLFLDM